MVTAKEAIKSNDPKEVKRCRSSINTQITCDLILLKKELSKEKNGGFDFEDISQQMITMQKKKLSDHFELIQKLHERYLEVRVEGSTDEEEELLIKEDVSFMENITSKVCPILDLINKNPRNNYKQ